MSERQGFQHITEEGKDTLAINYQTDFSEKNQLSI
jgi:hypothetical protein